MKMLPTLSDAEFHEMPFEERERVRRWQGAFHGIDRKAGVTAQLHGIVAAMREEGVRVSFATVRRRYSAWQDAGGDWRALVDGRAVSVRAAASLTKSRSFGDFFKKLCEENQRSTAAAIRALKRRWQLKLEVPGYEGHPGWPAEPSGWSKRNLARLAPSQGDLLISRKGMKAAARVLPQTLRTRVGTWCGSHIQMDDVWHDHFVRWNDQVVRVLEFGALDVWSGCRFAWGTRPRRKKVSGGHEGLTEREFRFFVAGVLWNHGYSRLGTTLMLEKGTAALREAVAGPLHDGTGGLVTCKTGAMHGETQALLGLWGGRAGGSGNFKSHLESLHNLIHNELAMAPGQVGKDRQSAKESTYGLVRYQERLLGFMATAPEEVRAALMHPLLDYHTQFLPLLNYLYAVAINGRTEHALEGWEEMGRVITRYTLAPGSGQWLAIEDLPETSRGLVLAAAREDLAKWTQRHRLSPAEVWQRGRGDLIRGDHALVADLIGPDLARERKVEGSYITFQDIEVSPSPLIYEARIRTPQGRERELIRGERYGCLVNPYAPEDLIVLDARGAILGTAERVHRTSLADLEGMVESWGRAAKRQGEILADVRERWAPEEEAAVALRRHNAELGFGGNAKRLRDGGAKEARRIEHRREIEAGRVSAAALANLPGPNEEDEGTSPYL